jgi:heme exporter protein D
MTAEGDQPLTPWMIALAGLFAYVGATMFLRVVCQEVQGRRLQLEALKDKRQRQARLETVMPVATTPPIETLPLDDDS